MLDLSCCLRARTWESTISRILVSTLDQQLQQLVLSDISLSNGPSGLAIFSDWSCFQGKPLLWRYSL